MTNDLENRVEQAIAEEEQRRRVAKAAEIVAEDAAIRKAAERKARQDQARDEVKAMMAAADVTLEHVATKFDAAVSALADLAQAALHRNRTIDAANTKLKSARAGEVYLNQVEADGVLHHVNDAPPRVLLARALMVVAQAEGTSANGFDQLTTDLTRLGGPLHRRTKVEEIRR